MGYTVLEMFLFITTLACLSPTAAVESIDWTLSEGWDRQPWEADYKAPNGQSLRLKTRVNIPSDYPIEGSQLRLSGLWWSASATVNSTAIDSVSGGIIPVTIDIGPHLKHGENDIELLIQPPSGLSSLLTGGSLSSVNPQSNASLLASPPVLQLRPKQHIKSSTVSVDQAGIHPWAKLSHALEGHFVHFELCTEESCFLDFGEANVNNGVATLPSANWDKPNWGFAEPVFYILKSTLKSPSGTTLHKHQTRVAPRKLDQIETGIAINDTPIPLLGARMVYRIGGEDWSMRMKKYTQGGVNSLELHGEWLKEDWLNRADEMGIPLVVVPRCIGRCNMRKPGTTEGRESIHEAQDARMVSAFLNHPSRVLYALEGPVKNIPLWTEVLLDDPLHTPVAGHHFPARILRLERGPNGFEPQCQPKDCTGAWLTETTMRLASADVPWQDVAKEYEKAIRLGSVGGIVPTPNTKQVKQWQSAWKPLSERLAIPQLSEGPFRAAAQLEVKGLKPYAALEINRSNRHPIVVTANSEGIAKIKIWAEGQIELRSDNEVRTLQVQSAQWNNFEYSGETNRFSW